MLTRAKLRARLLELAVDALILVGLELEPDWIHYELELMTLEAREIRRVLWPWLNTRQS